MMNLTFIMMYISMHMWILFKNKISILIILEALMIVTIIAHNSYMMNMKSQVTLLFMIMMVTTSILGISLLISQSKSLTVMKNF